MPRQRDYKAEYQNRITRLTSLGFSTKQARGHAGKTEIPVSAAKSIAKRYEIPLASVAKAPKNVSISRFQQQKTYRLSTVAPSFNQKEAQRMIDMGGRKYIGTSARIRLKNGKFYQTRVFRTASMGQSMASALGGKYGFSDDDIADIEFFNTEGI